MIKNFVKIAFRDLLKHKGLTLINISGLSIGLACFTLCLLYGLNEFNYDRFHTDSDRIFRVYRWSEAFKDITSEGDPYLPIPLGPALSADLPDIEAFVRIRGPWGDNFVDANGQISDQGVSFADPQFFEVFNFPLLYGDPKTALANLNNLVLTEKIALELFGESNPVGRTLKIRLAENFEPFVVTGVAKNIPSNSTIHFDIIGNFDRLRSLPRMERRWTNWNHSAYETYVKLRPG
ncbi:MAG: ABC transporter permease, partial [Saprospiraceae bacterium]|nr:ABC transporter permease [Saprospiraceae bacterium]